MINLLHLADLHLGWRPRFISDPAAAATYASERDGLLDQAVELALDPAHDVAGVIIAGDLFDDHLPDDALAERVVGALGRLVAAGIALVTVPGNHDEVTYPNSVYRQHEGAWPGLLITAPGFGHAGTVELRGVPVHFYGLAYTGGVTPVAGPLRDFARRDDLPPGLHVAVLHGTLTGGGGLPAAWVDDERSLPLDAAALAAAGYDYVALGHIHRPSVGGGSGDLGGLAGAGGCERCRYAGLVAGLGFDDPGSGRLTLVGLEPGAGAGGSAAIDYRDLEVRVRRFAETEVDLGGLAGEEALAAARRAGTTVPAGSLVRLRLKGEVSVVEAAGGPDLASLAAAAGGAGGHLHVEVEDLTEAEVGEGQLAAVADEPTVRGFFARRLAAQLAAARRAGNAEGEAAALAAWRAGLAALGEGATRLP